MVCWFQVCHFISICLTLVLAIWRYIIVTSAHTSADWCSPQKTKITILMTYVLCPLVCLPLFLSLEICKIDKSTYSNGTIIQDKDIASYAGPKRNATLYVTDYGEYKVASFWVYGVVIKLVPCVLLSVLSQRLISALWETKKRRKALLGNKIIVLETVDGKKQTKCCKAGKQQQTDRTTKMLLCVLMLFLLTEFPQSILGLLSVLIGKEFERQCYIALGESH